MADFKIITDSCCDLPPKLASSLGLEALPLSFLYKGNTYQNYLDGRELDPQTLYAGLRAGETSSTAAVNPEGWTQAIRPLLAKGLDVLVIAFSSGLSTTYNSAVIAAQELQEEFPQRKVLVCDSLSASMGQGLLVYLACQKQRSGATLEEVHQFVEDTKLHLCHWFTVDDLMFLKRGGRISTATAIVGSMLKIKPVLHVDDEGHLISVSKARGRRASLDALVEKLAQTGTDIHNQTIFLSHGDCLEDALYVKQAIEDRFHPKDFAISYVGPVIGSHSGPGTVALFWLGSQR